MSLTFRRFVRPLVRPLVRSGLSVLVAVSAGALVVPAARAEAAPDAAQAEAEAGAEAEKLFDSIEWQKGPLDADLGTQGTLKVPEGMLFADGDGARAFLRATQNIPSGLEIGMVLRPGSEQQAEYFVIFSFHDEGYIKDDEKDDLDGAALLESLREGMKEANKERQKNHWPQLLSIDWQLPPRYDEASHNLTWATLPRFDNGASVNHTTRILGRRGYVMADLVVDPADHADAAATYAGLLQGFKYREGESYAEYRAGDKVAEYGLTALVVGGVGAAAWKSGLLGKLWKLIVVGVVALGAGLKRLYGALTRRRSAGTPPPLPGPDGRFDPPATT